jgi:hypothetical protein
MPSLENWKPYKSHVQGGLPEGNYLNGQFILICAGPPFFHQLAFPADLENAEGTTLVYPIGLTQNIALSQNKAISRIFEIGSDRAYFISGRSVGQLSLGRVVYHGPSLLRALWSYYDTSTDTTQDATPITPLIKNSQGVAPFKTGTLPGTQDKLHSVKVPPGYDNMFLNLASDLFSQPMGLLLIFKDNAENTIATIYLDQCYVPQHSLAVDSQGLIIQESVAVQYERMIPIKIAQLSVVDGLRADDTAGFGSGSA